MNDREFLSWIFDRLERVHGENRNTDFMHRLKSIAERADNIKPKATIADLLTLHDLDIGTLAYRCGVSDHGEAFVLRLNDVCVDKMMSAFFEIKDWHECVADELPKRAATWTARALAALGAKVRAVLSRPTVLPGLEAIRHD